MRAAICMDGFGNEAGKDQRMQPAIGAELKEECLRQIAEPDVRMSRRFSLTALPSGDGHCGGVTIFANTHWLRFQNVAENSSS